MTRATICILGRRAGDRAGDLRIAHRHRDGRWVELVRGLPMLDPMRSQRDGQPRRWNTMYQCRECGLVVVSVTPS